MNLKTATLLLIALAAAPAAAQEQSHLEAAEELLRLLNADEIVEQSYDQMLGYMDQMAAQMGLTEEQRPVLEKYMEKMVAAMKEEMSWEKMQPYMLDAYVAVYSEQELRELADFYASPLGQKFLAKMPELMKETMQLTQQMMQDFLPRMKEIQQELHAELDALETD